MLPIHLPDDVFTLWLAPKYHLALSLFLLITLLLFSTSGSTTKPKPPSHRSPPEPGFISQFPQQEPGCPEPSSPGCWCWEQRTAALGQTQPERRPEHSQTRHKQPLLLAQLPPAPSQQALFAGKPNPTSNNRTTSGVSAELLSFLEEWGDPGWAEKNWTLLKASQKCSEFVLYYVRKYMDFPESSHGWVWKCFKMNQKSDTNQARNSCCTVSTHWLWQVSPVSIWRCTKYHGDKAPHHKGWKTQNLKGQSKNRPLKLTPCTYMYIHTYHAHLLSLSLWNRVLTKLPCIPTQEPTANCAPAQN